MKKLLVVGLYVVVIMLILSMNRVKWSGHTEAISAISPPPPVLNEASAPVETGKIEGCHRGVTVAVIDTGVDFKHSDLKDNLWKNPSEIANNGTDDDGNGFVDDVMGWDFVNHSPTPMDEHGHGTHVAGIIGAVGGNQVGMSGVCSKISLMVLKYYDPEASGRQNLENTVRAFHYAIQNGAHIINYSGGGSESSEAEKQILLRARQQGILVVAAAGNENQNADQYEYYPASYDLDNIVSVAAIDESKDLLESSNFGMRNIDIAAPGKSIYSTLPDNKYGYMTGTSQATAFVSGIAALALSYKPTLTVQELKALLLKSVNPLQSLKGKIKTGGAINAQSVLKAITQTPSPAVF